MVLVLFVRLQLDLLSLVYLVKRKRTRDFESDHHLVRDTRIDLFMVCAAAVADESTYSTGSS